MSTETIRLRAYWDQVAAMVRDHERECGPNRDFREGLAVARALLDYADELEEEE